MREVSSCKCSAVKQGSPATAGKGLASSPVYTVLLGIALAVALGLILIALIIALVLPRAGMHKAKMRAKTPVKTETVAAAPVKASMPQRAEAAAECVYGVICANYWPEGKREKTDSLWWIGVAVMDFVAKRKDEDFGESTKLLQRTLIESGCPDGPAGGITIAIMAGWMSPLYFKENRHTPEDVAAYHAYFTRLLRRLTTDYGNPK